MPINKVGRIGKITKSLKPSYPVIIQIILLILTNITANYLFIPKYTLYSDDWSAIAWSPDTSTPYVSLLLDAQRPLLYATDKFVHSLGWPTGFLQMAGLSLSCLLLVFLFLIMTKVVSDCGYSSQYLPFLICLIYIVLWNKDEIYPWLIVSTCNMAAYLLYAIAILGFLHRQSRGVLILSLISLFLGLLTYEIGLALPLFFIVYAFLMKKDIRESFYYIIPLILVIAIRSTEWFGYGTVRLAREAIAIDPQVFLFHSAVFVGTSLLILSNQIQFSLIGWSQMNFLMIGGILCIDITLLLLLMRSLARHSFTERASFRFFLICVIGCCTFALPFILNSGGTPTRGYIFLDFFIAGIGAYTLVRLIGKRAGKILFFFLFLTSLMICQGLYMNWVVSGEISDAVADYISEHEGEIKAYQFVYLNSTSFTANKPNSLSTAYHPTREDLFRLKRDIFPDMHDELIQKFGKEDSLSTLDSGYEQYFNAKCLDIWALSAMMNICKLEDKILIYGGNWFGNFPVAINNTTLMYQQYHDNAPSGPLQIVNRSEVFEIPYPLEK